MAEAFTRARLKQKSCEPNGRQEQVELMQGRLQLAGLWLLLGLQADHVPYGHYWLRVFNLMILANNPFFTKIVLTNISLKPVKCVQVQIVLRFYAPKHISYI